MPNTILKDIKNARQKVCDELASKLYENRKSVEIEGKGCRMALYGMNKAFFEQEKRVYSWLTRDMLENALRRVSKKRKIENIVNSTIVTVATTNAFTPVPSFECDYELGDLSTSNSSVTSLVSQPLDPSPIIHLKLIKN